MRSMDNTKFVDSIKLPLKSCEDALAAINKMLTSGLDIYLNHYVCTIFGDWPMQFFIRQLVYSNAASIAKELKNVVPLIGPLHISLNARECVLLNFHQVFADLYSFLFGRKTKLVMKPKPWRISVVGSYLYVWRMDTSKGHDYVSLLQVQGCPVSNTCESPRQLYSFGEHLFNNYL